jgi:energy-coupling factor transporter ATP-binding protein EcfA2
MSDPGFISLLTLDYLRIMADEYKRPVYGLQPKTIGSFDDLTSIMDADTLFKLLSPQLDASEFYQIMLSGGPGSGKSTLAREVAHYAHSAGYEPLYVSGFEITEAPSKLAKGVIGHTKVAIIFDDLSYVMNAISAKAGSKIKNFAMLIRHFLMQANGGTPVNILLIIIAHFNTAVPPVFKNSNLWIFTRPTMLEYDFMLKYVGRKQETKEALERIYNSLSVIQARAGKNKNLMLTFQGTNYPFKWGDKTDPGDGRLMLMILDSKPMIYQSQNVFCDKCKHIGFGVKIDQANYETKNPKQEDAAAAEKRGTQ